MFTRLARREDAGHIACIYNQVIEERSATFETEHRSLENILDWMEKAMPVVVVEADQAIAGFSACFPYRPRPCYQGVAEFCIYVQKEWRRQGAGTLALERLMTEAEQAGMWKMVARVFPENSAGLRLLERIGFRVVGTYQRHARLDDEWRDVHILEYLLSNARNGLTRPE